MNRSDERTEFQAPYPDWIGAFLPRFIRSDFFESSYGKVHYLEGGKGQSVFMLHGNPTWSFLWRKVIAELGSDNFHVIAPDLLNLGFSDALQKDQFSMESQAKAMVELIESLDLKDIIFVVQDWGGPIGLYAASMIPERVKSLVILNTGISAPKPPFRVSKFHNFVNKPLISDIAFRLFRVPMYHLGKVQGDAESISGDVAEAYRYPVRLKNRWDSALKFARMVPARENDPAIPMMDKVEEFVIGFKGPIEVVWGLKDPILGRALKGIRKRIPAAHVTETQGGHFLQEEFPSEIAQAIVRAGTKI